MSEFNFKGKDYVYNHHLIVPFRPLIYHPELSISEDSDNLIIHGDNLHALKALLPQYAGKVDCIYIDPPYNTGNENWHYNDNVNSPLLKEWLDGNPVNKDDMVRHEKWCCMMYPRLRLLYELLADSGVIFISIDDNEQHRLRMMMDEIFGEINFITNLIWQKKYAPANDAKYFSDNHDFILVYVKNRTDEFGKKSIGWNRRLLPRTEKQNSLYKYNDNDGMGYYRHDNLTAKTYSDEYYYPIVNPKTGRKYLPSQGTCWRTSEQNVKKWIAENRVFFGRDGKGAPQLKRYMNEVQAGIVPLTIWTHDDVGHTDGARKLLKQIFSDQQLPFDNPKSIKLIQKIISIATDNKNAIVLDSFAGSGTTGHAVLAQNKEDGGNRKFILIECEEYAKNLTAERLKRVIKGYNYSGTIKNELLREKITWSKFSRPNQHKKILNQIQFIQESNAINFDKIISNINNGELIVTGENKNCEMVEGLGSGFNYYSLGAPIELDKLLTGKSLPKYVTIGEWLFHTATGETLNRKNINPDIWYLGESTALNVWLIYKSDVEFLKSREAALTVSGAEKMIKYSNNNKRHLIFAPVSFAPRKMLLSLNIEFAQLPFNLYKFVTG